MSRWQDFLKTSKEDGCDWCDKRGTNVCLSIEDYYISLNCEGGTISGSARNEKSLPTLTCEQPLFKEVYSHIKSITNDSLLNEFENTRDKLNSKIYEILADSTKYKDKIKWKTCNYKLNLNLSHISIQPSGFPVIKRKYSHDEYKNMDYIKSKCLEFDINYPDNLENEGAEMFIILPKDITQVKEFYL